MKPTKKKRDRCRGRERSTTEKISHCTAEGIEPMWFCRCFKLTIDLQCAGIQNDYEEELESLGACLSISCLDKVCIEDA